jgi:hypothetical protein
MNNILHFFLFILISGSVLANKVERDVKVLSSASTVDNGDIHNLLRCVVFEVNGKRGVLLWKSNEPSVIDMDSKGNLKTINGHVIRFNELCEVNFIQKDFSVKAVVLKNAEFSENIRDYVTKKTGIDIPIISFITTEL